MTDKEIRLMELNGMTEADMKQQSDEERIAELEAALDELLNGVTE